MVVKIPKSVYIRKRNPIENLGIYAHGVSSRKGVPMSAETKKKLSELRKGKHNSPNTEFKKGEYQGHGFKKGHFPWNKGLTKETNEIIKEEAEKVSKARAGKHYPKLSEAKKGSPSPHTPEGDRKISETRKKLWQNIEFREMMLQSFSKRQGKSHTGIENKIEDWLKENNIEYESQKVINGIGCSTIVDFFVPPNICLFCDGDYWHTTPLAMAHDRFVNKGLADRGYEVIRLWGHEINAGIRPIQLLDIDRGITSVSPLYHKPNIPFG